MQGCFCYVTCRDREEALRIARTTVAERLAASANLLGETVSIYRWQGRVHEEAEQALVLKTSAGLAGRLVARVAELHSYACPGIVVLPIETAHPPYLAWLGAETAGEG